MKASFIEKLIGRLGRIGPEDVQNYFLRLAEEKGFLETIFNAIQEGIIVTDSSGRITYLNAAACELFGLNADDAIGKHLDERVRGLDWESLTKSGGPVSRDMKIFNPHNRFINFYIVPLVIEPRDSVTATDDSNRPGSSRLRGTTDHRVGHAMILRDITESRRTEQQTIESERLNALTLLAAGVAHEIGNPPISPLCRPEMVRGKMWLNARTRLFDHSSSLPERDSAEAIRCRTTRRPIWQE